MEAKQGMEAKPGAVDETCDICGKSTALCVCAGVEQIANRVGVLILQHPQEQDMALGTARLTALHLKHGVVKVGLSWPSLAAALGRPADAKQWAILYLGSAKAAELAPDRELVMLTRKGEAVPDQEAAIKEIRGVVVLDGTWSQAKALWWRNAWMLKCPRVILGPRRASRYGKLRKEARRDALSTIEATALVLAGLEKRPEIEAGLMAGFERMLARYRQVQAAAAAAA